MSYENEFLEDNKKHGRSIISLGMPETGKSHMALKYVLYCITNNVYDEYHIVAPMFNREENSSYDFLKKHKDKVKVYLKYDSVVSDAISRVREKKKVFFMVDDATAELLNNMDKKFIQLFTTTRHDHNGGLTMWIIVHSAKKVLPPMVRQNFKYLFLYQIESDDLLEDTVYREFLSVKYRRNNQKYEDFFHQYCQVMEENEYGIVLIARKKGVDFSVAQWGLLQEQQQHQPEKNTKRLKDKPQMKDPNIEKNNIENQKQDKSFNPFKKIFFLKNI